MDGPERLEDDARPARRRIWALVAVAVVVVAGLGALHLTELPDLPQPPPSTPSSTPSSPVAPLAAWPRGAGGGTLYVLDAGGVVSIDVGSGVVHRSSLSVDPASVAMTAAGPGVLVWPENGLGTPHLVAPGVRAASRVTGVLADGRQFLPGPGTAVWASPDDLGSASGRSTWRLVDAGGSVSVTVRLGGFVQEDGSGGLFAFEDARVRHVEAARTATAWTGSVGATGPDGYEVLRCAGRRCAAALHDRTSGAETPLTTTTDLANDDGAVLSPGNRYVASVHTVPDDDNHPVVVRVVVPGSGRELSAFAASDDATSSLTWLSDRWLAATADSGLVLYDAVNDRLVTPDLGLRVPTQLVYRPA